MIKSKPPSQHAQNAGYNTTNTHFELFVTPQNLRAQREVMHRALMVIVNEVTVFPILALVSRLCLALPFARRRRARRLCQFYALK